MGSIKIELTGREFHILKEALSIAAGNFDNIQEDRDAMAFLDELKNVG